MRSGSLRKGGLALVGLTIGLVLALVVPGAATAQNAPPPPCTLRVPADPLTAQGLATPWQLGGGPLCQESNPDNAAFVQGAVIDRTTGQISIYDPLVITRHTRPAIAPTVPALPPGGVVAIWIGYNGNSLLLNGPGSDACVQGVGDSTFGQNAFCNATAFFAAANDAIRAGRLKPPPLGMARDGRPCPTSRDFSIVDQDQSDNTTSTYLVTGTGTTAQDIPQNRAALSKVGATTAANGSKTGAAVATNGSDERLVSIAVDTALVCKPWTAPDLADATHTQQLPAQPLNELQAAADQAQPVAVIPALDPFVLVDNQPNLAKLNAYRAGVDQPVLGSLDQADTTAYCTNLLRTGLPRIALDRPLTEAAASPSPTVASNLFTFLAQRFHASFSNADGFLRCTHLLHVRNPVRLVTNNAGVVVGADIHYNPRRALNAVEEGTDDDA
jgi:hypothetical protein